MKLKSKGTKKTHLYQISYLGGKLSLEQPINATGKELFMEVCACLGITEYWYFGLQYESTKRHPMWIRPNTKVYPLVCKVAAPLFFLVKYYPEEIGRVQEDVTLALIYKQCKISIVTGAVAAPPETSLLLASYILQAEQGESSSVDYSKIVISDFLPPTVLEMRTMSHQKWIESLKSWHRQHRGMDTKDSHLEFMRLAQYLGMYGVSYFPTKFQGVPVWLGVHPKGINIYEDNLFVPKISLKWIFIRMIHYSCRKFIIKTMLTQIMEYSFYMKSLRLTRQVFEFAVGYHHLYLRTRSSAAHEVYFSTSTKGNDEKFNEITEHVCKNDTFLKVKPERKLSRRFATKHDLPDVKEEEENLIKQ
ncbi:hypothetical protein GE061_014047 [Apolygus lucorum]|uniref:Moesin/ezrin/radixin homolog 1 n=1 Tax=Apolygus lucorum TaxID=248454 RepID=A0A8S9XTL0_APOLU|nr:hypothetical protein GE061_014047 [Apolygus lucorum]